MTEKEKKNALADSKIQKCVDLLDKASTGTELKNALWEVFGNNLQDDSLFPAKTLQGLYPSDFVTEETLKDYMTSGLKFDAIPVSKSKKAVQSGGLADLFGDFQKIYDDYNKIFNTEIIVKEDTEE